MSDAPLLHPVNIVNSPGSTWAGAAAVLGTLSAGLVNGPPNSTGGWVMLLASVASGVGAMFSRA